MDFAGFYTKKDRVGRQLSCRCGYKKGQHPACQNCLILVGSDHRHAQLAPYSLPFIVDNFNDEEGVWERGLEYRDSLICETCVKELSQAKPQIQPTLRLAHTSPSERKARVLRWIEEDTDRERPRRRHIGGFVRVPYEAGKAKESV